MNIQKLDPVLQEFEDVFKEMLGQLPGVVHLEVKTNMTPHIAAAWRVPVTITGN